MCGTICTMIPFSSAVLLTCIKQFSHICINKRLTCVPCLPSLYLLFIFTPVLNDITCSTHFKYTITMLDTKVMEEISPDQLKYKPICALARNLSLKFISLTFMVDLPNHINTSALYQHVLSVHYGTY